MYLFLEKVSGDCLTGPSLNHNDFVEHWSIQQEQTSAEGGRIHNNGFHIVSPTSECIVVHLIGSGTGPLWLGILGYGRALRAVLAVIVRVYIFPN